MKFFINVSHNKNVIKKDYNLILKHTVQYAVDIDLKADRNIDEIKEYN